MGVRGELYSNRIILPNRTYFFNVKENRMGDLYLNIVESKNRDAGGFDRQSVILFADDLQEFLKGFDESLKALEKSVREKRNAGAGEGTRVRREEKTERPQKSEEYSRGGGYGGKSRGRTERSKFSSGGKNAPARERSRGGKSGEMRGEMRGDKNRFSRGTSNAASRGARSSAGRGGERSFERGGERGGRERSGSRGFDRGDRASKRVVVKKHKNVHDE